MKNSRFLYLAAVSTSLGLAAVACNRPAPAPTPTRQGAVRTEVPGNPETPLGEPARKPLHVDVHVGGGKGVDVDVEGRRTEPRETEPRVDVATP
ncbi:MAG TPA: hypothetical protein VND64_35845 [Pirellulales bacterium]|nr:hypothetical protein [Pirellulales bacterium]